MGWVLLAQLPEGLYLGFFKTLGAGLGFLFLWQGQFLWQVPL